MTTFEDRMDRLEIGQARIFERLKFQDKLIWGLYALLGSFIVAYVFH